MRIVYFTHSLASCWNHGNAHFLRGVLSELASRGHDVVAYEPEGAWSLPGTPGAIRTVWQPATWSTRRGTAIPQQAGNLCRWSLRLTAAQATRLWLLYGLTAMAYRWRTVPRLLAPLGARSAELCRWVMLRWC